MTNAEQAATMTNVSNQSGQQIVIDKMMTIEDGEMLNLPANINS